MTMLKLIGVAMLAVLAALRLRLRFRLLLLLLLLLLLRHMLCRSDAPETSPDGAPVEPYYPACPDPATCTEPGVPLDGGPVEPQDSAPLPPTFEVCPPPYIGCTVPTFEVCPPPYIGCTVP
jgi:hypothetical protein